MLMTTSETPPFGTPSKNKWRALLGKIFNRRLIAEMRRREEHRTALEMDVAIDRRLRRLQFEVHELKASRRADDGRG